MKSFLLLMAAAATLCAQVKLTQHDTQSISVDVNGKPFTEFFFGSDTNKPYLDPLRSASGKVVTRGYPMRDIPGESHDHPHHKGLWFTHGDVNGFDFWANEKSQENGKKGKVVLVKINSVKSGKDSGTIDATFNWNDPSGKTLLTEHRVMTFYAKPADERVIDFDITLKGVEKSVFGDTKEGTFAVRLAAGLEEPQKKSLSTPKRTGRMVNAQGASTEANVWGKRSEWVDYAGELEGEKLGVAIFDYPKNPKHPTFWHSRGYGLHAANIFGEHDFMNDKSRNGSMTLEPGQTWRFRYRVVIHPGDAASAKIAEQYREYSAK